MPRHRLKTTPEATRFVPHRQAPNSHQIVIRVTRDQAAFVSRTVERLRSDNPGLGVTQSDVVRMALAKLQAEREGAAK